MAQVYHSKMSLRSVNRNYAVTRRARLTTSSLCSTELSYPLRIFTTRRGYATEEKQEKSFRGQLYESTAQRLQRERAEQARFAEKRGRGGGAYLLWATLGIPFRHNWQMII